MSSGYNWYLLPCAQGGGKGNSKRYAFICHGQVVKAFFNPVDFQMAAKYAFFLLFLSQKLNAQRLTLNA